MNKYFYLGSLLVFFSLTALGTQQNEEERDALALQTLQKIVETAFPLAIYEASEDCKGDKERLEAAEKAKQEGSILCLPLDIFLYQIFPFLNPETLHLGVKLTCRSFYELTSLSRFCLNAYCLTETMPHAIPLNILCLKTHNTKDGIFKLAALMSVSAENLASWFERDFLKTAFLPCQNSLPAQLEGQSEEALSKLYPILKVALASGLVNTADAQYPVMLLLQEYPHPCGLSLNKLRLMSLNPTRPGVYYETLEEFIHGSSLQRFDCSLPLMDFIKRELLLNGRSDTRSIVRMNNIFFVHHFPKRDVAIQIMDWCVHNPKFWGWSDSGYDELLLINDALHLERFDWALKVLNKILELKDYRSYPCRHIRVFNAFFKALEGQKIENEHFQSCFKEFIENLYSRYWENLYPDEKVEALSLLMHAERRQNVGNAIDTILLEPEDGALTYCQASLFNDLSYYHYGEEITKLISYLVQVETEKLIPRFSSILSSPGRDDIFSRFIKTDREKTVALFKAFIESHQVSMWFKLDALILFAQHAAEEEKDYIISQVQSLNYEEKDMDNVEGDLAGLYYYLNNPELCGFYYEQMVQKMLKETDHESIESHAKMLKKLQDGGLNVECIEDLLNCDPFKFFSILLAKKD